MSHGRAGLQVRVSPTGLEARQFGRRPIAEPTATCDSVPELFDEAADFVEVVRRLWDSWEDDAEIRDEATGRFIDRDKLHYIDFEGPLFSVKGPSITPRPPAGPAPGHSAGPCPGRLRVGGPQCRRGVRHPHGPWRRPAPRRDVRAHEDAVGASAPRCGSSPTSSCSSTRARPEARRRKERLDDLDGRALRSDALIFAGTAVRSGRPPAAVARRPGIDGFRLRPGALPHDLETITHDLVPVLQASIGLPTRYEDITLRARLGLARPANRYATEHEEPHVTKPQRQIHLAAHFPGVNNTTVWSDPEAGSHIEFSSFAQLAQTAERAKFDFFFLAEGLRLREQRGKIHDLDVVGRPDTFTVLSALAAVTEHIGLSGTINSTFNEPFEVARQFASLDHLSDGRAAWNVVTSWDAFTGENFRRGGFLAQEDRYARAKEFLQTARELWDSWDDDAVVADKDAGRSSRPVAGASSSTTVPQFDIAGRFGVPRSPQGHPVIFQAGDSDTGREFAAADRRLHLLPARHDRGRPRFYEDVKGRLARYGRARTTSRSFPPPRSSSVRPRGTPGSGPPSSAASRSAVPRPSSSSNRSGTVTSRATTPTGRCPRSSPIPGRHGSSRVGRRSSTTPLRRRRSGGPWRRPKRLSIRELIIEVTGRATFVGHSPAGGDQIDEAVSAHAADGFILVPHVTPGGLDEFADTVVPILQEWGRFRSDYDGPTLRDHLGLPSPRSARLTWAAVGA